jgi:hypothetical protein
MEVGTMHGNYFLGLSIDVGVFRFENSFALKLEVAGSSETFVSIKIASYRRRLFKSYLFFSNNSKYVNNSVGKMLNM